MTLYWTTKLGERPLGRKIRDFYAFFEGRKLRSKHGEDDHLPRWPAVSQDLFVQKLLRQLNGLTKGFFLTGHGDK